jgi:hypothetical protein
MTGSTVPPLRDLLCRRCGFLVTPPERADHVCKRRAVDPVARAVEARAVLREALAKQAGGKEGGRG